jgi:hypothetical protein
MLWLYVGGLLVALVGLNLLLRRSIREEKRQHTRHGNDASSR